MKQALINSLENFTKKYNLNLTNCINNAKNKFGKNFFENFYLPKDFDLSTLSQDVFITRQNQKTIIPFSDELFKTFITMPKKPFSEIFQQNYKGKHITGIFLAGKHNGHNIVFALTISRVLQYNDYLNFCIKLDMNIMGKEWVQLLRFDSVGHPHPNYVKDGKIVTNKDEVELIPTPHLHVANQTDQILMLLDFNYMSARKVDFNYENFRSDDKNLFKLSFDYFKKIANIDIKVNSKIIDDYHYNFNNPLFDYDDINVVDDIKEL